MTVLTLFENFENTKSCIYIRAAGMYEDIRTGPHHVFRIQLTLSQPGGADYAHQSTMSPLNFSDLATALSVKQKQIDTDVFTWEV